jgi:hypothetical protein
VGAAIGQWQQPGANHVHAMDILMADQAAEATAVIGMQNSGWVIGKASKDGHFVPSFCPMAR